MRRTRNYGKQVVGEGFVEEKAIDEDGKQQNEFEKLRVKFLRLAHRLGQTTSPNVVVTQVLHRLEIAERLWRNRNFSNSGALPFEFQRETAIAEQESLEFTCTIMLLGKTGVGKSATINSIFDEARSGTDAFQLGTNKVEEIVGTVEGIEIRVIDTPGLVASNAGRGHFHNKKVLRSVKQFIKKTPPDIVLYFDRLDMQGTDQYGEVSLLRSITETFGAAVWLNAIVVLTHAACPPPDGPHGNPLSYEAFISERSNLIQQGIRQASGDMELENPVCLVENHSARGTATQLRLASSHATGYGSAEQGQDLYSQDSLVSTSLPREAPWKPELLLLCFSCKTLAEARALFKFQESPSHPRVPYMSQLLSSLLKSRGPVKTPKQIDEQQLDCPEILYFRSHIINWPLPLPPSFEGDNPAHRYDYNPHMSYDANNNPPYLTNKWLVEPQPNALEINGWDHDIGYEGVAAKTLLVFGSQIPVSVSGRATKDKKDSTIKLKSATSLKLGEGNWTFGGLDIRNVGKDLFYTLRSGTRFSNFKNNTTGAGLDLILLGNAVATGMKLEDILNIGNKFKVVVNGGAITSGRDLAYGGIVKSILKSEECSIAHSLSIMNRQGNQDILCNLQSIFPVGQNTFMEGSAYLNNRGGGKIKISTASSENPLLVLIGIITVLRTLVKRWKWSGLP